MAGVRGGRLSLNDPDDRDDMELLNMEDRVAIQDQLDTDAKGHDPSVSVYTGAKGWDDGQQPATSAESPASPAAAPASPDDQTASVLPDDPAFVPESRLLRAALAQAYLKDSSNRHRERYFHRSAPLSMQARKLLHSRLWQALVWGALMVLLALVYFEEPAYRMQRANAALYLTALAQSICAGVYLLNMAAMIVDAGLGAVFRKRQSLLGTVIAALIAADGLLSVLAGPRGSYRVTRWLRPVLIVLHSRSLRQSAQQLLRTCAHLYIIAALVIVLLLTLGGLGTRLFYGAYRAQSSVGGSFVYHVENFNTILRSMQLLFYVFTRKTSPNVIWPATIHHTLGAPYFIFTVTLANYFIFPIIVAIMTSRHQAERRASALKDLVDERRAQMAAFQLLDVARTGRADVGEAVAALAAARRGLGEARLRAIHRELVGSGAAADAAAGAAGGATAGGATAAGATTAAGAGVRAGPTTISLLDWFQLCDISAVSVEQSWVRIPVVVRAVEEVARRAFTAGGQPRAWAAKLFARKHYDSVMVVVTFTALVVACLSPVPGSSRSRTPFTLVYWVCLATCCVLFCLRASMRVATVFVSRITLAEGWILLLLCVSEVLRIIPIIKANLPGGDIDDILRCLVGALCILHVRAFRRLGELCFRALAAASAHLFVLVTLLFYSFAVIGNEMYAGRMNPARFAYLNPAINWDTFTRANLTLFHLTVVANWPQVMVFTEPITGTAITVVYFIVFDIIVVVVVLSLLTSLFMEAYNVHRVRLETVAPAATVDDEDALTSAVVHGVTTVGGAGTAIGGGAVRLVLRKIWARDVGKLSGQELAVLGVRGTLRPLDDSAQLRILASVMREGASQPNESAPGGEDSLDAVMPQAPPQSPSSPQPTGSPRAPPSPLAPPAAPSPPQAPPGPPVHRTTSVDHAQLSLNVL